MSRRQVGVVLLLILTSLCADPSLCAHEVRPAYLQIQQLAPVQYKIVWKQPAQGEVALRLVPHLSTGWLEQPAEDQYSAAGFVISTWHIRAAQDESLTGATVEIEGLADSITDALLSIRWQDGKRVDAVLRPDQPQYVVAGNPGLSVPAYLLLGIKHILSGPDHLLFVFGLCLLVSGRWMLLKTVTAFTLAHSITLALTVFGRLHLPSSFAESIIALSILFLACEIVRKQRGDQSMAITYPWLVAFVFGLFHGTGFGGALLDIGFPADALPLTLALFNVGVEIGQLVFVAVILWAVALSARLPVQRLAYLSAVPVYLVGISGAYWTIERSVLWILR